MVPSFVPLIIIVTPIKGVPSTASVTLQLIGDWAFAVKTIPIQTIRGKSFFIFKKIQYVSTLIDVINIKVI